MNILLPIDPAISKPNKASAKLCYSERIVVKYSDEELNENFALAYYDYATERWYLFNMDGTRISNPKNFYTNRLLKVIEWYKEVQLESLFPDDDTSYNAAKAAGNETSYKTFLHQEGQSFFKNSLLRAIKKYIQQ